MRSLAWLIPKVYSGLDISLRSLGCSQVMEGSKYLVFEGVQILSLCLMCLEIEAEEGLEVGGVNAC